MDALDTMVEDCLAILAGRSPMAPEALLPRQRTLWASKLTGRRGRVLWASEAQVCLSFDETNTNARKVYSVPDFFRLYLEV